MEMEIPTTTTLLIKGNEMQCTNPSCRLVVKPQNMEGARLAAKYGGFICRACRASVGRQWAKYLESDHWKRRRARAVLLAEWACQLCKSTKDLQVHHNTYERLGGELDSDLIVLCGYHHKWYHELEESVL